MFIKIKEHEENISSVSPRLKNNKTKHVTFKISFKKQQWNETSSTSHPKQVSANSLSSSVRSNSGAPGAGGLGSDLG